LLGIPIGIVLEQRQGLAFLGMPLSIVLDLPQSCCIVWHATWYLLGMPICIMHKWPEGLAFSLACLCAYKALGLGMLFGIA